MLINPVYFQYHACNVRTLSFDVDDNEGHPQ